MLRYFKLYFNYLKVNIKGLSSYGTDFLVGIFAVLLQNISILFVLYIIFDIASSLGDWTFHEVLFLYGFSVLSYSVWHTFFINTISMSYYVKTGTLDSFLLKPMSVIFQIMTDSFDDDGFGDFIFGSILIIYALYSSANSFLLFPFVLIYAILVSLIYSSITIIGAALTIIFMDNSIINNTLLRLNNFSKYPLTIYPKIIRIIFTAVIPIGLATYYPSLYIIKDFNSKNLFFLAIIVIIYFIIATQIFKLSLKKYKSTGT